jgi:hypothetical protein
VRRAAHALRVYEERQLVARRARKPTKTGGGSALAATGPTPTHGKKNGSAQPLRMPTATQLKAQGMEQVDSPVTDGRIH